MINKQFNSKLEKGAKLGRQRTSTHNVQPPTKIHEHSALEDGCLQEFKKKFVVGTLRLWRVEVRPGHILGTAARVIDEWCGRESNNNEFIFASTCQTFRT